MRALQAAGLAVLALVTLASWASCSEVWLYTLVSADYDGVTLMPHLLEHYYGLKVPYSRMLVNVHHNPEKYGRVGLDMILGTCASYRVYCRVWEGPFTSEDHYNRTLALLADYVLDPDDWVVVADSDELQDYGGQTIPAFLADAEQQGSTYVVGTLLDRLAPGGRLPPLSAAAPLPQQFPLECRVVKGLYNGWDFKVVAFKAFLRAGRANHVIVKPDKARAYFGPCVAGQKCPRGRNIYLEEDWFASTPYAQFARLYRYKTSPPNAPGLWDAIESPRRILINHYKWHAGVLPSMRDRAQYYSGDCVLGVNEDSCTPQMLHWRESAKTFAAIKSLGRLSLDGMHCQPAGDALPQVQTQQQQPLQLPAQQQQLQQRTVSGAAGQVTGSQGGPDSRAAQQGQQALLQQQVPGDQQQGQQQQQQGQQGPDEPAGVAGGEEGEQAKDSELPEYEPDGVVEEDRGARKAARAAAKAASKAGLLAAAEEELLELPELPRRGGKDKKTRRRQEGAETGEEQQRRLQAGTDSVLNTAGTAAATAAALTVGAGDDSMKVAGSLAVAAGAIPAGIAGVAAGGEPAGAELDEVQQLAAASAAQQAQQRTAAAAVARAGAGMHPGLGSLEAAVETVAVAVEGDDEDRVDAEEGGVTMLGRRGGSGGSGGNVIVAKL